MIKDSLAKIKQSPIKQRKTEVNKTAETDNKPSADLVTLSIIHTNDIHGNLLPLDDPYGPKPKEFTGQNIRYISSKDRAQAPYYTGGISYLAAVINQIRQEAEQKGNPSMLLDGGDIALGTLESKLTKGKATFEALNYLNYDAAEAGNHDFDWGREALGGMVNTAKFPILGANIRDTNTDPVNLKPYIIKDMNGVKVGVIGICIPSTLQMLPPEKIKGLEIDRAEDTLNKYIPEVKKQGADLVVVLSHLGFDKDQELADNPKVKGIDVIVGAHSHTEVETPIVKNGVIIVQAGQYSQYVGELDLQVNPKTKKIVSHSGKLIPIITDNIKPDYKMQEIIAPYIKQAEEQGSKVITRSSVDLTLGSRTDCNLKNIFADSFCDKTGAPICLLNGNVLKHPIPKGDITVKKAYECFPFDDQIVTMDLPGKTIRNHIEYTLSDKGKTRGVGVVSGLKYTYDPSLPNNRRVTSLTTTKGEPIDSKKIYGIVTNGFLATRPGIEDGANKTYCGDVFDNFAEYLKKLGDINIKPDGRVQLDPAFEKQTIATTETELTVNNETDTNLKNLFADGLRSAGKTQIAVFDGGALKKPVPKGKITKSKLYNSSPYDNKLITMNIKGNYLKDQLEASISDAKKQYGPCIVSGIRYSYDLNKPEGRRISDVLINNEPLNLEKDYQMTTDNYMEYSDAFKHGTNAKDTGLTIFGTFVDYVKNLGVINLSADGRIKKIA